MRKRRITMTIRVTEEERGELLGRMAEAAEPSLRAFLLALCREGKIVVDREIQELNKELRYQGNNLNQLVRLAHAGRVRVVNLDKLLQVYTRLLTALAEEG